MNPILEETIYLDFIVSNPATGAAADADSTPTCEVFENATDTAIISPTVTKRTSKTGDYRIAIDCTAANGFGANKSYNVIVSATVSAVAAKASVAAFQVRSAPYAGGDTSGTTTLLARVPTFPVNFADLAITATTGRVDVASIATGGIATASFVSGAITAAVFGPGAINAAAIDTDAITSTKIATGAIISTTFGSGAIDATAIASDAITAAKLATDAGVEIAYAVWDLATTGHFSVSGSFAEFFSTKLDAAVSSRMATYTQPTGFLAATFPGSVGTSTYAGGDTSGTTTILSRLTSTRAGYLDNLSAGAVALASGVTLSATQGLYAPSKAGDAMTLTGAYDAAKTAASAAAVWANGTRTVTGLPNPAPSGYGFSGDVSGMTTEEHDWLSSVYTRTGSGRITVTLPVSATGTVITIVKGDDYKAADGRALQFASSSWPDITGATLELLVNHIVIATGEALDAASLQFELTKAETAAISPTLFPAGVPQAPFTIRATLTNSDVVNLAIGVANILQPYS